MHIMHNIIHVSSSAGKQLHVWIRSLSKLGEANYTIWQLFADLPKTIWWSQSSSSQAGVCFAENISIICVSDRLARSLSRQARAGQGWPCQGFFPLAQGLPPSQAGRTDWECLECGVSPHPGAKRRVWMSSPLSRAHKLARSTKSNRKSNNYVGWENKIH